jgi:hypothetical protein
MCAVHDAKGELSRKILGKPGIESVGVEADPDGGSQDVIVVRYIPEITTARGLIPSMVRGTRVVAVPASRSRPL